MVNYKRGRNSASRGILGLSLAASLLSGKALGMVRVETIHVPKSVQALPDGVIQYLQKLPRIEGNASTIIDKARVLLQFVTRFSPTPSQNPWRGSNL